MSTQSGSEKTASSRSSCPDSILEKSKMSLMIESRVSLEERIVSA